ncbi:MAG: hypothetical protein JWQ35_630 [Bacteriovoracaceae bacterium]|nr:hypothetical protein [Bacteriovoracaceae bacterium]
MLSILFLSVISMVNPNTASTKSPEVIPNSGFDIVSDYDDTLKMSNVPDALKMDTVFRSLFSHKIFAGSSVLINALVNSSRRAAENESQKQIRFMVITGSPPVLKSRIDSALTKALFPDYYLRLRDWSTETDLRAYKTKILLATMNRKALLFGDDTEHDPEAYDDFQKLRPEMVLAVYIHRITGNDVIKPGQKTFLTPFDIAYSEFQAKRLNEEQVAAVAASILEVEKSNYGNILPNYALGGCAKRSERTCGLTDMTVKGAKLVELLCKQVADRMEEVCKGIENNAAELKKVERRDIKLQQLQFNSRAP